MIELDHCPSCNSKKNKPFLNCIDHTVSRETFRIVACEDCQLLFTNPRPETKDLGSYYESEDYISHSNSNKGLFNKAYQAVRFLTIKQKVKMLGKANGQLVEIGCGTGELLKACTLKGWDCQGVEPNTKARNYAQKENQLTLHENIDKLLIKPNSQKRIMLWHVLEHLPNLSETLSKVSTWLHPEGKLFIAVPNPKSADAKHYQKNWAAYDVPRHLSHFTKDSMEHLIEQHGMRIKEVKGMPFDAFYVSMLSEKIKSGKSKMMKGFTQGLRTNLSAWLGNKEYSSLIYIIESRNEN